MTETPLPDPTFLDDRLAHWAARTPDAEAVTYLGRSWTWAEWDGPCPPARGRARRPRGRTRRRGLVPGQEPSGLRRAHHGRLDARRGQRDRQLPAGRRRGRLRGQRCRRQGAAGRHRADAAGRPDPRPADHRRARDRGDARRRGRRRLRGVAGRCAAPAAECRRRPGGRVPGHVLLRDHRSSEGRHAQPPQHGAAHDQRPRRLVVRARRQEPGGHAVVPRRWLVVRAVRHPRRHPQRDDPRPRRRLARRRDPERRQPHVPGARGARPGAEVRTRGDRAVRPAPDLHLWSSPDAAAVAARRDGGVARHRLHAGLRPHRGRRRDHAPDAAEATATPTTPSGWSRPAGAPGRGAHGRRPGHARGVPHRASTASSGSARPS